MVIIFFNFEIPLKIGVSYFPHFSKFAYFYPPEHSLSGEPAFKSSDPESNPKDIKKHLSCSSTDDAFDALNGVPVPLSPFPFVVWPPPVPGTPLTGITIMDFSKKSIAAGSLTDFLPFLIIMSSVPIYSFCSFLWCLRMCLVRLPEKIWKFWENFELFFENFNQIEIHCFIRMLIYFEKKQNFWAPDGIRKESSRYYVIMLGEGGKPPKSWLRNIWMTQLTLRPKIFRQDGKIIIFYFTKFIFLRFPHIFQKSPDFYFPTKNAKNFFNPYRTGFFLFVTDFLSP
jgi:hypothetical protein